jgi:Protein of unknown function (DUF2283)
VAVARRIIWTDYLRYRAAQRSEEPEAASVELSPNVTAELNDRGERIGIEILDASSYVRDSLLESAQARMLRLSGPDSGRTAKPVARS